MMLGKLIMKLDPYSHSVQKIKPKWTKILNVRPKTLKLQKENIGETLEDLGFSE
jgi:hypothetical protein